MDQIRQSVTLKKNQKLHTDIDMHCNESVTDKHPQFFFIRWQDKHFDLDHHINDLSMMNTKP